MQRHLRDQSVEIHSQAPAHTSLRSEIIEGLLAEQPSLPAKLHYDERGSELFEQICELPEYYLTRTELSILDLHAGAMASQIGSMAAVIEPGSGAGLKTERLIGALDRCAGYVPIDISDSMLASAAARIASRFPGLPVAPVHADFMGVISLPSDARFGTTRALYFPGSTMGNFGVAEQERVLRNFSSLAGRTGCILVGFDLVKSVGRMEAAYNDTAGITAEFNFNVIDRLHAEFGIGVSREDFEYFAEWDDHLQAIVSWLAAVRPIDICVEGHTITLNPGDRIKTEESHKYTHERIRSLAASCDLNVCCTWCDESEDFAVALLRSI